MTPLKYFVATNISLIMFGGSFAAGFMVGNENKTIFHTHIISYLDVPSSKNQSMKPAEKLNVVVKVPSVSDDEFDCLAKTIYFEAGNQSYYGKIAVGSVVMNRVNDDRYPDTICGVITQHRQFSWYSDGKSDVPFDGPAWENSIKAAKEVLCGCDKASGLFDDASVQYYHADYVSPSWAKKMTRVAKIDNHIFYR
jgi:spore germination cell wall hydrolase CwlJ-like protein